MSSIRPARDTKREFHWIIEPSGSMRVPGVIYATQSIIKDLAGTKALQQVANVACLPGILEGSFAMPDIHEGYGFPIGGVAAVPAGDGFITPGGIGYDINCGVRVLLSPLARDQVQGRLPRLVEALFRKIPSGVGKEGPIALSPDDLERVLVDGAQWAVGKGYGSREDLTHCEEGGAMAGADPGAVSERALRRGRRGVGTLGSGNHFIEAGAVSEIFDYEAAKAFGLFPEQVVFWVHSGSRGLGHQVCTDYLVTMRHAVSKYGPHLPDRQLDGAPLSSPEGRKYFSAMAAAANYAWANRQVLAHYVRQVACEVFPEIGGEENLPLLYDVAHNIGKLERHTIGGREMMVLVHRKGATRAFPPGHPDIPEGFRTVGQPVLVPGDMGRASYILSGTQEAMGLSFGSACHGAGRAKSRAEARRDLSPEALQGELRQKGIHVRSASLKGLVEEAPSAYKDVDEVVAATHGAGLAKKVAKLRPLAVIKG
ncbi:MAG: RtcB family protein [Bacillota bacterium]|jgi:tRNA-splicing ligase RtcB|nr:RtcB family protein [Candidatus Fermentithermobacillaceae bacterium]